MCGQTPNRRVVCTWRDEVVFPDSQTPRASLHGSLFATQIQLAQGECFSSLPSSVLPLLIKGISTLPVTKAPTLGVLIPNFSLLQKLAAAPYNWVPVSMLYSSSPWHYCSLILTISYLSSCNNLPAISLASAPSSALLHLPSDSPFKSASLIASLPGSKSSLT